MLSRAEKTSKGANPNVKSVMAHKASLSHGVVLLSSFMEMAGHDCVSF